jgi:predicted esterase
MIPLSHFDLNRLRSRRTQILISAGEWDPIAEPPIAKKLAELLTAGEQDVAVVVHPGVGHELTASDVSAARQWLAS